MNRLSGLTQGEAAVGYTYTNDDLTEISHNGFTYGMTYDLFGHTLATKVNSTVLSENTYDNSRSLLTRTEDVYKRQAVDLFCGCGGMSLGFQNAGIEILAAYDNWAPAINIYRDNFQHPVFDCDLNSIEEYYSISTKFKFDEDEDFKLTNIETVSYTHLDVYKRQGYARQKAPTAPSLVSGSC